MEHLKNIAAGLLGFSFILVILGVVLAAIVMALQAMDWVLLHRPGMFKPLVYAAGGLIALAAAWSAGRAIRTRRTV